MKRGGIAWERLLRVRGPGGCGYVPGLPGVVCEMRVPMTRDRRRAWERWCRERGYAYRACETCAPLPGTGQDDMSGAARATAYVVTHPRAEFAPLRAHAYVGRVSLATTARNIGSRMTVLARAKRVRGPDDLPGAGESWEAHRAEVVAWERAHDEAETIARSKGRDCALELLAGLEVDAAAEDMVREAASMWFLVNGPDASPPADLEELAVWCEDNVDWE